MESSIIIVINMQNDFVYGKLESYWAQCIISSVQSLLNEGKKTNSKIIFVRDTHDENEYSNSIEGKAITQHCIKGSDGWNIIPELDTTDATIIDKNTFGFLNWKDYIDENDNRNIIITGTRAEGDIISNALILRSLFPNKRIIINTDCISGFYPNSVAHALEVAENNLIEINSED